jgi:hypothetical protein
VVSAVAATAGGQRCIASIDRDRKRSQAEEQNEQDGADAPHLGIIVHELWNKWRFGKGCGLQVSSTHPNFPIPGRKVECLLK